MRQVLLDEHVGRVFERVLRERGHDVEQAKDVFGEATTDAVLLRWCGENAALLMRAWHRRRHPLDGPGAVGSWIWRTMGETAGADLRR